MSGVVLQLVLCLLALGYVHSLDVSLEEMANYNGVPGCRIKSRSGGVYQKSVWLFQGEFIVVPFCLTDADDVFVSNIIYSNDGSSDTVKVYIDDGFVGSFTSNYQSDRGAFWNMFNSSGPIGNIGLKTGAHELRLTVSIADAYGIELNSLEFEYGTNATVNGFVFCNTDSVKGSFLAGKCDAVRD